jgi:hypothetical protein
MSLSCILIHGVKEVVLTEERKLEKSGRWVRTLKVKHSDGTTTIDLFADHVGQLKVVQR